VWGIVQAHTARLYGVLLRGHFVFRNKIFHCVYFSMHFRIKFLLFNDFPSYMSTMQMAQKKPQCPCDFREDDVFNFGFHTAMGRVK
jgi:hypothetical protein